MKNKRHDKIIEIIASHVVETQDQLAMYLRQAGYDVTQATISRDIRKMKLTKQVTEDGDRSTFIQQPIRVLCRRSM